MVWKPAKHIGLASALIVGGSLGSIAWVFVRGLVRQPLDLGFYGTLLASLATIALLVIWGYRTITLLSLRYLLDRNALVIEAWPRRYVIPLDAIQRVMRGQDLPSLPWYAGLRWPGFLLGSAKVEGLPPLHLLGTEPPFRQIILLTEQGAYGISPREGGRFLQALEAHRTLGPLRAVREGIEQAPILSWPIWQDSPFWGLLLLALALNLILLGVILWRYPALPERIALQFGPEGEVYRIGPKIGLLAVPSIGAATVLVNALLGVIVHRRERPASLLLGSTSLAVQGVLWLAALGILP
ncbi:MAG: DUF1648 domain-containing protein [Chloroflexi bacterium]|nr:DUF1648 domain-containing protein [Chloroflexota bacterium]